MKPSKYRRLHLLAALARPRSDEDWGSDRQIEAENEFFDLVQRMCPKDVYAGLTAYCLKATTDECISAGLEAAKGMNTFSVYRPKHLNGGKKGKKHKRKNQPPRERQPWEAARPER